jgi:cupin superfamily acireductone dioxygenase involved in methionine salvage
MALVRIPERQQTIADASAIAEFLGGYGIAYERCEAPHTISAEAPPETVLAAYADKINELNARGGYTTADVI